MHFFIIQCVAILDVRLVMIPFVSKIWVYGNSFKSMLVAVVIPDEENTKKWGYSNGHMVSFSELCSLDQLKNHVISQLKSIAERNKVISTHT